MNPLIKDQILHYFDCFLIDKTSLMYGKKETQCIWGESIQDCFEKIKKAKRVFLHPNVFFQWSEFLIQYSEIYTFSIELLCICHSDISFNTVEILPIREALPNTKFWIQNWCGDLSGCEIFPIGINFYGIKTIELLQKKKELSITFVTPNSYDRMEFHNFLCSSPEMAPYCLPFLDYDEYFSAISEALFVVCPCGNGYDTYRFWECLYYRTIPIVKTNHFFLNLKKQYPNLPFLLLNEWSDLITSLDKLTIEYYTTLWSTANISVSTNEYWLSKLN